jgi:hypothetical protein
MAPPTPPPQVISGNSPPPSTIQALPSKRHLSARTLVTRIRIHNQRRPMPLIKTYTSTTRVASLPSDPTLSTILVPQLASPALRTGPMPTLLSSTPTPNSHNIHLLLLLTITSLLAITGVPILKQRQSPLLLLLRRPIPNRMHPLHPLRQSILRRTQWTPAVLISPHQRF